MLHLDGYTGLERIGHGGLGDVYRATRASTGRTVAIKVLRDVSDESVAWHRTRRELTALVSLGGHAHVVQVVEVLEHTPGLVMEYAPGGSVAQLLDRRGATLDLGEVVLIGRHTAAALAAAHEQGIVHRDVKPQNLLVDAFGQVKLCDFGIASLARTEEFRTRTSAISMRYASPEDLEDDAEVGPRADVYSLGATLLHLLHGAPPTLKERLAPWAPPPTEDPWTGALDAILADCLRPEPGHRPTAQELLERLEALEWELPDRRRALDVEPPVVDPAGGDDDPAPPSPPVDVADALGPGTPGWSAGADDSTRYRTGRVPRPLPAPAGRDRRRWPLVGGAVAVVLVSAAVLLLASGDADAPGNSTLPPTTSAAAGAGTSEPTGDAAAVSIVERPDGLVALDDPDVVWPLGAIGECLVQVADVDRLQVVDCASPHDLQRFAVGSLDDATTSIDTPDQAELELAVADLCLDAAPSIELPGMEVAQTNPSSATWVEGDRGYQCLLGVPGRRLIGSALD